MVALPLFPPPLKIKTLNYQSPTNVVKETWIPASAGMTMREFRNLKQIEELYPRRTG